MTSFESVRSYLDEETTQRISDKKALDRYLTGSEGDQNFDRVMRGSLTQEMRQQVREAVSNLSHIQKKVVYLRYWESHDSVEISAALGISEDEVFKTLTAALAALRKKLVGVYLNSVNSKNRTNS